MGMKCNEAYKHMCPKKSGRRELFRRTTAWRVKSTARSESGVNESPLAAPSELDRGRGDSGPETRDTEHPRGDRDRCPELALQGKQAAQTSQAPPRHGMMSLMIPGSPGVGVGGLWLLYLSLSLQRKMIFMQFNSNQHLLCEKHAVDDGDTRGLGHEPKLGTAGSAKMAPKWGQGAKCRGQEASSPKVTGKGESKGFPGEPL